MTNDDFGDENIDRRSSDRFPTPPGEDRDRRQSQDSGDIPFELDNPEVTSVEGNLDDPEQYPGVEDNPLGFVRVDTNPEDARTDDRRGDDQPFEERNVDFITIGTDAEAVMADIDDYTNDEETLSDFSERQEIAHSSDELLQRLREHTSQSPNLSGDDIDATWELSNQAGEESVGGSAPTPDQDIVEELGEAVGINYEDTEPLNTEEKLRQRDQNRWELDPASADSLDLDDQAPGRFAVLDGAQPAEGEEDIDLVDYLEEIAEEDDDDELDEDALVEAEDDVDRQRDADRDKADVDLDEEDAAIAEDLQDLTDDGYDDDDDEGYEDDDLDDLDDDFLLGGIDEDDY